MIRTGNDDNGKDGKNINITGAGMDFGLNRMMMMMMFIWGFDFHLA